MQFFTSEKPFELECGACLPEISLTYNTYGRINADRSNVIWVCHALTANSDVKSWWPDTVEKDKFLDPDKYFVICANILGSCYGSTGPLSINPATNKPYFNDFPLITVKDIVKAHRLLAAYLNINKVKILIGSSIGGFQCLQWAVDCPTFAENMIIIASAAKTSPWVAAFNESQRMAIESDCTFYANTLTGGEKGLAAARSTALLSYRGPSAYNKTQADSGNNSSIVFHRACTYQRYQGEKLCKRFNAYSYYRLTQAIDSHDIGRSYGGVINALKSIKSKTLIVAISSDILFPPDEHAFMAENIPDSEYHVIDSDFGHDGFLIESGQLNDIIQQFINKKQ
ncbi:MAG: homoserine O-acetyltransferase [Bacteroidales bacterium]|nr:homoserine O-acetyltransferase [Bacteroidales bacterium]